MPRRVGVEIFGDEKDLLKAFKNSEKAARQFNSEMNHLGHRGREVFHGLGRSLAFATGGAVAFHSITEFLGESVTAARDAQKAHRSLAAQMKASGESFQANREQIEKTAVSYGKFGFENDEVVQSLTVLERATGNIEKAQKLQGLVADLARARNLKLASAAAVVGKVFGGQETALRRAVPGLDKAAHGTELLRLASQKLAGQAAANTTASEKFHATLHDTEEIIGNALLPVVDTYLGKLGDWLQKQNESGKLQKKANAFMQDAVSITTELAGAVGALANAYGNLKNALDKLPGGTKFKLSDIKGPSLMDLTGKLPGGNKSLLQMLGLAGPLFGPGKPVSTGGPVPRPVSALQLLLGQKPFKDFKPPAGAARLTPRATAPTAAVSAAMRNTWFDARVARELDRVQDLSLPKQVARLKQITQQLRAQKALVSDRTRKLTIEDEIVDVLRRQRAVEGEITDQKHQQLQAAKDRRAEEKQAAKEAIQAAKTLAEQIKSATIDRLQRRQTGIENQRAIRDAAEQLRQAKAVGGPGGIRAAARTLADAKFQQRIFGLQAAPATLRGGQFGFAGITINIHGVTDPDEVARRVVAAIERRNRHTTKTFRGPAAGTAAANR